jgi:Flp pilus assembly protein TadG
MKNVTLVDSLWREREGSTFLEFTVVFPLLMLTAFCTVDFALIMFGWAQANKAVQNGVRVAVVGAPVAEGINDLTYVEVDLGKDCSNPATGAVQGWCEQIETVCTATSGDGSCTGYTFDNAAFEPIFDEMRTVSSTLGLQRENVRITYRTIGLGFVGRPGGFPMEVTVELTCVTHRMFFLGALAGWAFEPRAGCAGETGVPMPSFATTLTTESLGS